MSGVSPEEVQKHVERMHGVSTQLVTTEMVREVFGGEIVWKGLVHVFRINGHPDTDTCYAWSAAVKGSDKRRFYAVLKIPPIDSSLAAVRAAIVADHKAGRSI
jgi:hypothetical protein